MMVVVVMVMAMVAVVVMAMVTVMAMLMVVVMEVVRGAWGVPVRARVRVRVPCGESACNR